MCIWYSGEWTRCVNAPLVCLQFDVVDDIRWTYPTPVHTKYYYRTTVTHIMNSHWSNQKKRNSNNCRLRIVCNLEILNCFWLNWVKVLCNCKKIWKWPKQSGKNKVEKQLTLSSGPLCFVFRDIRCEKSKRKILHDTNAAIRLSFHLILCSIFGNALKQKTRKRKLSVPNYWIAIFPNCFFLWILFCIHLIRCASLNNYYGGWCL